MVLYYLQTRPSHTYLHVGNERISVINGKRKCRDPIKYVAQLGPDPATCSTEMDADSHAEQVVGLRL